MLPVLHENIWFVFAKQRRAQTTHVQNRFTRRPRNAYSVRTKQMPTVISRTITTPWFCTLAPVVPDWHVFGQHEQPWSHRNALLRRNVERTKIKSNQRNESTYTIIIERDRHTRERRAKCFTGKIGLAPGGLVSSEKVKHNDRVLFTRIRRVV